MILALLEAGAPNGVVIPSGDIWYWVMSAIGFPVLAIVLVAVVAGWVIWERVITPSEAREIRNAKRKKQPLGFCFNDAGQGWFERFKRISSSGAASTTTKVNDRKGFLGYFARKSEPTFEKPENADVVADNLANYVDSLQTTKIYLKDSKIPINVIYRGKALITSFLALAGIELAQKMALTDGGIVTEACPYCGQNKQVNRVIDRIELTVINITRFFKNISQLKAWDESEQEANQTDHFYLGIREEQKKATKNPLLMLLLALGFCFGMAVLLVVVAFILK